MRRAPTFIPPDAYPQMMSKKDAAQALQALRSVRAVAKAAAALEANAPLMHDAVLQYVEELESTPGDVPRVFEMAHEIRGLAETAGMITAGRICNILCRYMDEIERRGRTVDTQIVTLHISAIARAARAQQDNIAMGKQVAAELVALVSHKLRENSGDDAKS